MIGAPVELTVKAEATDFFEVWSENSQTLEAFLLMSSFWDVLTGGEKPVFLGIRATEIAATLELLGFSARKRKRAFRDIREMERAAAEILNGR